MMYRCQNCGEQRRVSRPCKVDEQDYICDACASRDVTIDLVKHTRVINGSTFPRIIHVTKEVIH